MDVRKYFNTLGREEIYYAQVSSKEFLVKEKKTEESYDGLSLLVISAIATLGILFGLWRSQSKKTLSSRSKPVEDSIQTSCTKCRFFDNNTYLKCAVHPTKVLKKEAEDCMDYEAMETIDKEQKTND